MNRVVLLGAALAEIPITPSALATCVPPVATGIGAIVAGALTTNATAWVALVVVAINATVYVAYNVVGPLWKWASAPSGHASTVNDPDSTRVGHERIAKERQSLAFEAGATHIAVCGVAGSGKSSLVNALQGLGPKAPGAAATGNAETTTARTKYATHASIRGTSTEGVFLHDLPGSGTVRVTAAEYYHKMQLYLFDHVFIVQGARFSETDAEIIRSCVIQGQMFTIIRSHMDTLIENKIQDSDGIISSVDAKESVWAECEGAIMKEMERAGLPPTATKSILPRCALVNRQDLRSLTVQDPAIWPQPRGPREMLERELLIALGKVDISNGALAAA